MASSKSRYTYAFAHGDETTVRTTTMSARAANMSATTSDSKMTHPSKSMSLPDLLFSSRQQGTRRPNVSELPDDDAKKSSKKRRLSATSVVAKIDTTSSSIGASESSASSASKAVVSAPATAPLNPVDFICAQFRRPTQSSSSTTTTSLPVVVMKSTESPLFKHKPTEDQIISYNLDVVNAIRKRDLVKLRQLHDSGQSLNCCNRFGEALIHMACRRGLTDIVKYMVQEADVKLYVHDDFGRTPIHYACWTPEPNLDLLDFLIRQEPDLLMLSDVRGHMPFSYVRKEHWKVWLSFLEERMHLLQSKQPSAVHTVG